MSVNVYMGVGYGITTKSADLDIALSGTSFEDEFEMYDKTINGLVFINSYDSDTTMIFQECGYSQFSDPMEGSFFEVIPEDFPISSELKEIMEIFDDYGVDYSGPNTIVYSNTSY